MNIARSGLHNFIVCLGLAILAACGEERTVSAGALPAGTSPGGQQAYGAAHSGDLLNVAHGGLARGLSVLTFPQGKPVLNIPTVGSPTAVCSDASGNIWTVVGDHGRWSAYEYAHGGKTPIAKIGIPHAAAAEGCAIDPTTGDLAVVRLDSRLHAFADIWTGARKGKPASFPIAFTPTACTYDDNGNLFVDGWFGDTVLFELGELTKGANSFTSVTLNRVPQNYPGGIQWGGKYVALVDKPWVYRISVSGSTGKVVGRVFLKKVWAYAPMAIEDGVVVATTSALGSGNAVALWPYPGGGKLSKILAKYQDLVPGLAISVP